VLSGGFSHELVVLADAGALAERLATDVVALADEAIRARAQFRIALAGGSTPRLAYEALAEHGEIEWQAWHVFFSDERCVPPENEQSNYRMIELALLSRVAIRSDHVHRMRGELEARAAARLYEAELGGAPLDLVLLGLGQDGHTASLFPNDAASNERERRVVPATAPDEPKARLTLTLRALDEARAAWFLVTGTNKAGPVADVLAQRARAQAELPAARVVASSVRFYLDRAAASKIAER
jgi:6-phosphogluconolactonase